MFEGFHRTLRGYIRSEFIREYGRLNVLAALIGVFGAFIAIAFRWMITAFQEVFFVGGSPMDNSLGMWIVVVPAIGAVFVGVIVYWFAPEVKGAGVADVMRGIVANKARFRARAPALKALASSITLGSGGAGGREGPIVQIGASFASAVGQRLKLTSTELRIMVACGAAGAIAATFNTPISGAVFALELLLLEFRTRSFIPLIISTVFATLVSRVFLGDYPTFDIAFEYRLENPYELGFYLGLGVLAGLGGVLFIKVYYRLEDAFDSVSLPLYFKPIMGALLVGAIGLFYPEVLGVGYDTVASVLNSSLETPSTPAMAMAFLAVLFVLKMLATSLTLGSGGSAGLFGPSLFLGAMLGAAFGILVNEVSPFGTAGYGAYAMVGMAAVFASTSRATLTAILMLFEMTSAYEIILPLMFACVVADAVSSLLSKETIYTAKLAKQGIEYVQDLSVNILESAKVRDAMTPDYTAVKEDTPLRKVVDMHLYTGRKGFPAVSADGRLKGVITLTDVRKAFEEDRRDALVKDVMTKRVVTVYPGETLQTAMEKMVLRKFGHLPVVDPDRPNHIVGMLDREAILDRYRSVLAEEVSEKSLQGRLME
ncbi:MAG: chloride channel protein [Methanobacteriota archaeon]|nr:MAG: chloride channel protein [Euryarchaeota archaeon]